MGEASRRAQAQAAATQGSDHAPDAAALLDATNVKVILANSRADELQAQLLMLRDRAVALAGENAILARQQAIHERAAARLGEMYEALKAENDRLRTGGGEPAGGHKAKAAPSKPTVN